MIKTRMCNLHILCLCVYGSERGKRIKSLYKVLVYLTLILLEDNFGLT